MQKVFLMLAFCAPVFVQAETLDTVTFNPARLGQFERVKISDALNAPGGVKAQSVTVQSGGSVDVDNAGAYDVSLTQVKGSANLPDTELYSPAVNAKGGTLAFEAADKTSKVNNLAATSGILKLKSNALKMNSLKVLGQSGQTYGDESLRGLKLGGNEIKPGNNCTGLQWVKRTASDDNVYQVLAMGTCGGASSECTPKYGTSKTTDTYMRDTCPGFDPNSSYTCSNFSQSCVDIQRILQTTFTYSGQGYAATASTVDTCNGDRENKFSTSPSSCPNSTCRDVYSTRSGSPTVGAELSFSWKCDGGHFTLNGPDVFQPNIMQANIAVVYNQTLSGNLDVLAARLCSSYANDGVHDTVYASDRRAVASCYNTDESPGYYRIIKCPQLKYYYQDGTCKQTVSYRDIDCCPK